MLSKQDVKQRRQLPKQSERIVSKKCFDILRCSQKAHRTKRSDAEVEKERLSKELERLPAALEELFGEDVLRGNPKL